MDGKRFDARSRSLATASTRRGLMRLLGALPLIGVLLTDVASEPAGAKGHRTPQRHHADTHDRLHQQKKHKQKKQHHRCTPESAAQTCAGRCGSVPNTCGTPVDCGACTCPLVCPVCQTCNTMTGHCEANPAFLGQVCGALGQVCQSTGACICDGTSCPAGQRCNGLACACDASSCPTGCCDGTTCRIDNDAACGTGGTTCTPCSGTGQTCGGGGTPGVCGCTPDCTGKFCGDADGCGGTCQTQSCGPCQTCVNGSCTAVPNDTYACDGTTLNKVGSVYCTNSGETGICIYGACSCVGQTYDSASNRCLCNPNPCAGNPPPNQCCHISQICSDGNAGSGCFACP